MKLGIIEDSSNKQRLAKLLRFQTTKSEGKLTSFDEYIARMKPKQKDIYFLAGGHLCLWLGLCAKVVRRPSSKACMSCLQMPRTD